MARVRALMRFRDAREKAHDPGDLFECDDDEALRYAERGEAEILGGEVKTSASRSVSTASEADASAPSGEQQPTEDAAPQPTQTTTTKRKRRKGSSGAS